MYVTVLGAGVQYKVFSTGNWFLPAGAAREGCEALLKKVDHLKQALRLCTHPYHASCSFSTPLLWGRCEELSCDPAALTSLLG